MPNIEDGGFLDSLAALVALVVVATVFIAIVSTILGRKGNKIALGTQLVVLLGLVWLFRSPVFRSLGLDGHLETLGDATATLWWLSAAFLVNALIRRFVWEGVFWRDGESTVPKLLTDAAAVFTYLIAIMVVMHFVYDKPIAAVAATSGAAAFVFGYSAKETLGDVFAGLSLSATHTMRIGDWVEVDDAYGQVRDMNWRAITLFSTHNDSHVIVPNSKVAQSKVINYGLPDYYCRGHMDFQAESSAPPELVIRSVREALMHAVRIRRLPSPDVHVLGNTQFGTEYRVRYRFDGEEAKWEANDEVYCAIWSALKRVGVGFAFNRALALPVREFGEECWSGYPEISTEAGTAVIRKIPAFSSLPEPDLVSINARFVSSDFLPPERLCNQGQREPGLFIILEGRATVYLRQDGRELAVAEFGPGDYFGMLPDDGGEHIVSVQAETYLVAHKLDAESVHDLAGTYPEAAKWVGDRIRSRMAAYQEAYLNADKAAREALIEQKKKKLVNGLADELRGFLASGGLLKRFKQRRRSSRLVEGAMAAAALVATADGVVDESEINETIAVFDELKLLEHVSRSKGLAMFERYVSQITTGHHDEPAWASVRALSGDRELAELVLRICHAVSAADGSVDLLEEDRISAIAQMLALDEETHAVAV